MKITKYTHADAALWPLVGPLLCSREVPKALGGPVYSDPTCTWWVATAGKKVVGFTCLRDAGDEYHIEASWVEPGERGAGVHAALCEARDRFASGKPVVVQCKLERWHHYEAQGYTMTRQRGQWVWGRKPAAQAKEVS